MLAQKFVVKVIASIVSSLLMFVSLLIMTRYVGDEYGAMMWGWAMVGLFNVISDLGFDTATVKFISQGKDQNACVSTHLFLKLTQIGVITLIVIAYLAYSTIGGDMSQEKILIILAFLVYYIIADICWVLIRTFDGRLEAGNSSLVQTSDAIVRSLVLIVLALMGVSATTLSLGYVVGIAASLLIAIYLFRKIGFKLTKPIYLKEYVEFAKPIAIGLLLVTAITFIDKVVVEFFCGSIELGYYTATLGVVYAATAIGIALNYVLLPKLSDLFSTGEREAAQEVLWKSEKYISILFLPVIIFMMVFGDSLAIVVFGIDYAPAGSIISILALYTYLNIIAGILTQVLYSTNNNRLYRNSTIVYALLTMVLLVLLIPEEIGSIRLAGLGVDGAAWAITIGYLVFTILVANYNRIATGLSLHKGLVRQYLASAILFVILFLIKGDSLFNLIPLIALAFLCLGLFYLILFVFREMDKNDLKFVMSSLNLKKLYDASKKEGS